jgi:ribosomal protein L7Ae-like RNA K-turn-binding protein
MGTEIPEPIARMLGLARRAREVTVGLRSTTRAAERHTLRIILLAADASARTAAELRRASGATPVVVMGSMEELGALVGAAPVAVVGVRHGALALQIGRLAGKRPG